MVADNHTTISAALDTPYTECTSVHYRFIEPRFDTYDILTRVDEGMIVEVVEEIDGDQLTPQCSPDVSGADHARTSPLCRRPYVTSWPF